MVKNKTTNRFIGKILFVGLLTSTLPATMPLKAQDLPKLSKAEVATEIQSIKKTVRQLKVANVLIPGMIITAGAVVVLVALGVTVLYTRKRAKLSRIVKSIELVEVSKKVSKKGITEIITEVTQLKPSQLTSKGQRLLPLFVAVAASVVAPVAALLATLNIKASTMTESFDKAELLERTEKEHPGTLTEKQKTIVTQLKNLYMGPITRGIIKYLKLKDALKAAAKTAMKKKRKLATTIGGGNKKKTERIIARYIKKRWKAETLQSSIDEMEQQSTKAKLKWNLVYGSAKRRLKRTNRRIARLEKRFPSLKKVKRAVQDYSKKADTILEELTKPALKPEKEKPVEYVVPL